MQVFDGWSYAVGDVVLGTNPVSSDVDRVAAIELALRDVLAAFGLEHVMPHCVLAHIDVQAEAEARVPGSTALWFQSLGGVADANAVFGIDVARMTAYAGDAQRAVRDVLRNRAGRRRDQRPRQRLRHGDPRVAQVRVRPRAQGRGRRRARRRGTRRGALGARERCRRLHRPGGVPHEGTARARLPRRHGDGKAARADHRVGHLFHAAHGRHARRSRLVHRAGDAREPGIPHGAAYPERSDAVVSHHRVPGSRPRARAVRLQGERRDVGVLRAAGRHRRPRPADQPLRGSDVGLPAVPQGVGRYA